MANERKNTKQQAQELDDDQMERVSAGWRPSPKGDGTTEHFFTVEIGDGQSGLPFTTETPHESAISGVRRISPDTIDLAA